MDTDDIGALAADYEFFGESAPLMDMNVLKGHGIAALAGMGGALLTEAVFGMDAVESFFNGDGTPENPPKPGYRALAQFLFGIAGARAIYHFEGAGSHPAAYGFVGQVSGSAAAGGAMMLYNQYAAPAMASGGTQTEGLGRMRRRTGRRFYGLAGEEVTRANYLQTNGLAGETEVTPVAPYYDRYKVSVPMGTGQAVNGLGEGEADGQPGWPADDETPDVGTWIS
jgi:hypothetical protein